MKLKASIVIIVCIFSINTFTAFSQTQSRTASQPTAKSLLERLGYPPDAKLLIVHADDLGMAHSVNAATTRAFATGLVNSGSIMIPCPWLPEVVTYAKQHPEADLGLHLTLTSEWAGLRWK